MNVTLVVGNPKPRSRTLEAGVLTSQSLLGVAPTTVVDLVDHGARLLSAADTAVEEALAATQQAAVLIVASPTYKASYTGLLKLFLDRLPGGSLRGVLAVPLMLGAGPMHALAPEVFLKPVLVELGATCPTRGLFLNDKTFHEDSQLADWVTASRPLVHALVGSSTSRSAVPG